MTDNPSNFELEELTDLAKRFIELELYDEAIQLFELALRLDPRNMGIQLSLAQLKQRSRPVGAQPRTLKDSFREAMRRSALDAKHFLGLAYLYRDRAEEDRAIEALEIAIAKDLPNPAPHKLYGSLLFKRHEFARAAVQLLRARRYNPFDRQISELLARCRHELGDHEGALASFIDAFLLLPDSHREEAGRLRTWIQDIRDILEWSNERLSGLFHRRQEELRILFDRLEWHRERFEERTQLAELDSAALRQAGGRIELAARLRQLEPWSHLSDEQIFELTAVAEVEEHVQGTMIFAEGTPGADFYVVEKGEITVQRQTSYGAFPLGILKTGEILGEVNFISRSDRSGDAVASQSCQLIRIDSERLDRLMAQDPELGVQIYWSFWHNLAFKLRCTNEQLRTFFSQESIPEDFRSGRGSEKTGEITAVDSEAKIRLLQEQGLNNQELIALAGFSTERTYEGGTFIFEEGDPGAEMFVVLEGRVRISKFIPGGGEEALAILERGGFFGEMALIDGQPRSADARAHGGPATVIALDEATIHEVLTVDPEASLELLQLLCRLIAERLRQIDEKVISWRIMAGQSATA